MYAADTTNGDCTQTSDVSGPEHYGRHRDNERQSVRKHDDDDEDTQNYRLTSLNHGTWPVKNQLTGQQTRFPPAQNGSALRQRNNYPATMTPTSGKPSSSSISTSGLVSMQAHQRMIGAKVDVVYSLLGMLGSGNSCDPEDREDMSATLLSMSCSMESCHVMRQSGCLPLLIQLIHEPDQDPGTRERASRALRNVVNARAEEKIGRREFRVLRLLEQIRDFCHHLRSSWENPNLRQPRGGEMGSATSSTSSSEAPERHPGPIIAALMKLSFDEAHRHAMCQLGALHAIAELVELDHVFHGSGEDPSCITIRRYAGMALTNLTFGDGANKTLLCSFRGFMRALVGQLRSFSDDLRQVTASVLRNLSWRADFPSKQTLREVGAVRGLMIAAMDGKKELTLKSVLSALWNLSAHCSTNKIDICAVDGALAFLVDILSYKAPSKTLAIVENAGGILRNVSSHIAVRDDYRKIVRDKNFLQILLQQLRSPSLTVVSNACGALWNLSARCPQDQKILWELGAVPMLRSLVHSKHKMISMGSSAALKNLLKAAAPSAGAFFPLDSTARGLGLPSLPILVARRQRALEQEIDENLAETCDNIEPNNSPIVKDDKFSFKMENSTSGSLGTREKAGKWEKSAGKSVAAVPISTDINVKTGFLKNFQVSEIFSPVEIGVSDLEHFPDGKCRNFPDNTPILDLEKFPENAILQAASSEGVTSVTLGTREKSGKGQKSAAGKSATAIPISSDINGKTVFLKNFSVPEVLSPVEIGNCDLENFPDGKSMRFPEETPISDLKSEKFPENLILDAAASSVDKIPKNDFSGKSNSDFHPETCENGKIGIFSPVLSENRQSIKNSRSDFPFHELEQHGEDQPTNYSLRYTENNSEWEKIDEDEEKSVSRYFSAIDNDFRRVKSENPDLSGVGTSSRIPGDDCDGEASGELISSPENRILPEKNLGERNSGADFSEPITSLDTGSFPNSIVSDGCNDEEDLLAACISVGMQKNRIERTIRSTSPVEESLPDSLYEKKPLHSRLGMNDLSSKFGKSVEIVGETTRNILSEEKDENVVEDSEKWAKNGFLPLKIVDSVEKSAVETAETPTLRADVDYSELTNFQKSRQKSTADEEYSRCKDPDAMIASLDRLTATLVQQTEAMRERESARMKQSALSTGADTWTVESPSEASYPSLSISAPFIGSFRSETAEKSAEIGSKVEKSAEIGSKMEKSAKIGDKNVEKSAKIEPIDPWSKEKKSLPIGSMAKRAISSDFEGATSLESLLNNCSPGTSAPIENIMPPSLMDELLDNCDMENSMLSVASITSEIADGDDEEDPTIFDLVKPIANVLAISCMKYAENCSNSSPNNSITDFLEDINPPSLFGEISRFDESSGNTDLRDGKRTEGGESTSGETRETIVSSPLGRKQPKKIHLTPKQKRQLAKERYKTYTIAGEMVEREEIGKRKNDEESAAAAEKTTNSAEKNFILTNLTAKQRRQEDPRRFQTQIVDNSFLDFRTAEGNTGEAVKSEKEKSAIPTFGNSAGGRTFTRKKRGDFGENRYVDRSYGSSTAMGDDRQYDFAVYESRGTIFGGPRVEESGEIGTEIGIETMLQQNADIVLNTLNESDKTALGVNDDSLLDCETLSLVSNESEPEIPGKCRINDDFTAKIGIADCAKIPAAETGGNDEKSLLENRFKNSMDFPNLQEIANDEKLLEIGDFSIGRGGEDHQEEETEAQYEEQEEEDEEDDDEEDEESSTTHEENPEDAPKRPKIVKPTKIGVFGDFSAARMAEKSAEIAASPKPIRGRRKNLYSAPKAKKITPQSSPIKQNSGNNNNYNIATTGRTAGGPIVRATRATTLRLNNNVPISGNGKDAPKWKCTQRSNSAEKSTVTAPTARNYGKRSSIPQSGSSTKYSAIKSLNRHSTPSIGNTEKSTKSEDTAVTIAAIGRQGTFTKDETTTENPPTVTGDRLKSRILPKSTRSAMARAAPNGKIAITPSSSQNTSPKHLPIYSKTADYSAQSKIQPPSTFRKMDTVPNGQTSQIGKIRYVSTGAVPFGRQFGDGTSKIAQFRKNTAADSAVPKSEKKVLKIPRLHNWTAEKSATGDYSADSKIPAMSYRQSQQATSCRLFRSSTFERPRIPEEMANTEIATAAATAVQATDCRSPKISQKYRNSCDPIMPGNCKIPVSADRKITDQSSTDSIGAAVQFRSRLPRSAEIGNDARQSEETAIKRISRSGSFISVDSTEIGCLSVNYHRPSVDNTDFHTDIVTGSTKVTIV